MPCFAVRADGLCSWLEACTQKGITEICCTMFATTCATTLHQMHTLFCCLCSWTEFTTGIKYKTTKSNNRVPRFCYCSYNWAASNAHLVLLLGLLGCVPGWNIIPKSMTTEIRLTILCYYSCNYTASDAHPVLTFVLLHCNFTLDQNTQARKTRMCVTKWCY